MSNMVEMFDKSSTAWRTLNKAVKKDSLISAVVMIATFPFDAWSLLQYMVGSGGSSTARESARKGFDELCMTVREPTGEYITRAKGLAAAVKYHGVDVTGDQLANRILTSLPPHMHLCLRVLCF